MALVYADGIANLPMVGNVTAVPSLGYRMFIWMDHCPTGPCGGQR
ncbi:hypothetical protein BH24CHL2_BH24CHL2_2310 [soil metagenome]